ncbi:hypothetical protein DI270_028250 [Microbispora triticiradicis]|uniref:Uncharacterized protein n=1 Tax=Microbispora triticiradicis TaxID=2200763 RepID=A0ABX9LCK1_9ACTN|nr:hypothetical protein DI270_028250 [Microbispora triticiradicis]
MHVSPAGVRRASRDDLFQDVTALLRHAARRVVVHQVEQLEEVQALPGEPVVRRTVEHDGHALRSATSSNRSFM